MPEEFKPIKPIKPVSLEEAKRKLKEGSDRAWTERLTKLVIAANKDPGEGPALLQMVRLDDSERDARQLPPKPSGCTDISLLLTEPTFEARRDIYEKPEEAGGEP